MTGPCRQFDEAMSRGTEAALAELRPHAAGCSECAAKLSLGDRIDAAAPALRRSWESPALLPRILSALELEKDKSHVRPSSEGRGSTRFGWIPLAAAAALFVIATVGLQVFRNAGGREPLFNASAAAGSQPLMSDRSLEEVESAEANYVQSIEKLSALVRPQLDNPTTPLLVSYREKLLVLDSAISEMRGQIESNRFNSHLRRELLAMYQEKQRTLQEIMKEAKS
jgi:hypothetical protein